MSLFPKAVVLVLGAIIGAGGTLALQTMLPRASTGAQTMPAPASDDGRREAKARADLTEQEARLAKANADAASFKPGAYLKGDAAFCGMPPDLQKKWAKEQEKQYGHVPNCAAQAQ